MGIDTFADDDLTEDRLMGGRVRLLQPRHGYRAATDPVLLAAACPARPGQRVLDLGCGAGAAALCLLARVPGAQVSGLEREAPWIGLAQRNAALNSVVLDLHHGDVAAPPAGLRTLSFDHVIANPPYHPAGSAAAPDRLRDRANREETPLAAWIDCALRRLKPKGRLTLIHRADRVPDILAAIGTRAGSIVVKPLAGREGRAAKRIIVTATKGGRSAFRLDPALVLHRGSDHLDDKVDYTGAALSILSEGAALPVGEDG